MDFKNRVTIPSIKNFQLESETREICGSPQRNRLPEIAPVFVELEESHNQAHNPKYE